MESFGELLFILFIVYSLFGGLFGRKQRQQPPPPRQRVPSPEREQDQEWEAGAESGTAAGRPRPEYTRPGGTTYRQPDPDGSAAEMLPDELWELLTGERRTPPPSPRPLPYPEAGIDEELETEEVSSWERGYEERETEEISSWERGYAGSETPGPETLPTHEEPIVVSLEGPLPPPEVRHAAFHERFARLPAARRRPKPRLPQGLGTLPDLRRAIVLREVLGPPKALE